MKKRKRGMVSVFSAVSIVLILSLFLTLLEGARITYTSNLCNQQAKYALQSYMSQFHEKLMKYYEIYGVDNRLFEEKEYWISHYGAFLKTEEGMSFLNAKNPTVEGLSYRLLTDDGGADFRRQAATAYKYKVGTPILEDLKDEVRYIESLKNEDYEETVFQEAKAELMDVKDSPIHEMEVQKQSFLLSQVLPNEYQVSTKQMQRKVGLEYQALPTGNLSVASAGNNYMDDKIFFSLYLQDKFQNALDKEKISSSIKYQQEYLIIGKNSDQENLEGVVKKLLFIREISWFTYRMTDSTSRQQAKALASSLTTIAGLPVLSKPVELGILLAWSYEDAIQDITTLLEGGKVTLIPGKRPSSPEEKQKILSDKVSYEDFLLLLLIGKEKDKVTYRALDVIEEELSVAGSFVASEVITAVKGTLIYDITGVFRQITWKKSCSFQGAYNE